MKYYSDSNLFIEDRHGLVIVAPAGVLHAIKKNADSCDVKVFWFHSAV